MYSATIHIDLDSDYVLSDLKTVRDEPFSVYYFEVFDKDKIRFVINAGKHRDAIADILRESDAVQSVEFLSDSQLLIAKYSSGVLPIIHNNHGRLRNMSQFEGTRRIFDIVIFARENIKEIVKKLGDLGTVRLEQLRPFGKPTTVLSARQSEVLTFAYNAGYFDWPRHANAETLADQLDITHATFLEHIRKAESEILAEILGDMPPEQKIIVDRD
jgi:predicted DNA binding protein